MLNYSVHRVIYSLVYTNSFTSNKKQVLQTYVTAKGVLTTSDFVLPKILHDNMYVPEVYADYLYFTGCFQNHLMHVWFTLACYEPGITRK